jgi:hypothetical protein
VLLIVGGAILTCIANPAGVPLLTSGASLLGVAAGAQALEGAHSK